MTLVSIPENPVPEGATAGTLRTRDGVSLRFARFDPPPGRRGTVCLFHGRTEFIEKYFEVVRDLRARGFGVATLDWRGQGLSQRRLADARKGHITSFMEYERDIETFVKEVVLPDCSPPFYAIGHSMGATILIRTAYRGRRWFDRIVLSAPMIDLPALRAGRMARLTAHWMWLLGLGSASVPAGRAVATLGMQPFAVNPLTSDPVRYERTRAILTAEPRLAVGLPTVSWVNAAFRTMEAFAAPAYPASLRQPMLIVAAGQDSVVSTPAIEQFAMRMRAGGHIVIAGAKHELMMERDLFREQFFAAFDAFVPGSAAFAA